MKQESQPIFLSETEAPTPILTCFGITYLWSRAKNREAHPHFQGIEEISFELYRGEILALLGPNGSGKSTLLKAVAGLLPLRKPGCSGLVRFRGSNFLAMPPAQRAQAIVYASADLSAQFPITVEETVTLSRTCRNKGFFQTVSQKDRDLIDWAMEKCLCFDLRHRTLDQLSGGERQRVALASALVQGGRVLFLDETLSRVDLNHQAALGALLKELALHGWAIILVAHDINFATEWADRAMCLKEGKKIFEGSLQEAISPEKLQALYPQTRFILGAHPQTGTPKVFFEHTE